MAATIPVSMNPNGANSSRPSLVIRNLFYTVRMLNVQVTPSAAWIIRAARSLAALQKNTARFAGCEPPGISQPLECPPLDIQTHTFAAGDVPTDGRDERLPRRAGDLVAAIRLHYGASVQS
jgi:hypothetical protein